MLHGLAVALGNQERWQEAEPYAIRALEIFRETHGPGSTMVASTLDALTEINAGQGDYVAADTYFRELEEALQQEETHPELGNPDLREHLREKVKRINSPPQQ